MLALGHWHPSICCPGAESQNRGICAHFNTVQALYMESPENPTVSSATLTPTGFYSQKLWGFIFLNLDPRSLQSGLGLGSLAPKVSLPIFIYHM